MPAMLTGTTQSYRTTLMGGGVIIIGDNLRWSLAEALEARQAKC